MPPYRAGSLNGRQAGNPASERYTPQHLLCTVMETVFNTAEVRLQADLIAARQKFFGFENVDKKTGDVDSTKVIFAWITNASLAVSVEIAADLTSSSSLMARRPRGGSHRPALSCPSLHTADSGH